MASDEWLATSSESTRMRVIQWLTVAVVATGCGSRAADTARAGRLSSPPAAPYLMFLSLASDDSFHHVSLASLASLSNAFVTPLTCERVYFSVDRGICLNSEAQGTATAWFADVFDSSFQRLFRLPLAGTPSRVRLSPDGRRAAATMFETGHAYDEHGFSTRTTIIDTQTGKSREISSSLPSSAMANGSTLKISISGAQPSRTTTTRSTPPSKPRVSAT